MMYPLRLAHWATLNTPTVLQAYHKHRDVSEWLYWRVSCAAPLPKIFYSAPTHGTHRTTNESTYSTLYIILPKYCLPSKWYIYKISVFPKKYSLRLGVGKAEMLLKSICTSIALMQVGIQTQFSVLNDKLNRNTATHNTLQSLTSMVETSKNLW